jgi:hypothetical protein
MKQLLPYFLFFVGSALVLVQCGKTFPTEDKFTSPQSQEYVKPVHVADDLRKQEAVNISAPSLNAGLKEKTIIPFISKPVIPGDLMANTNYHVLFFNTNNSLKYYNLVRKYYGN